MKNKLTFNETTYEFHYYEPNGKPAFNIQKNGEFTPYNLVWDEDYNSFNLFEEVKYEMVLVSTVQILSPFSLFDVVEVIKEINIKKQIKF
jgi:hypothetical protein